MNQLRLQALTCPQCGAPRIVRQSTRITECERCGVRLCLTETDAAHYEVVARVEARDAASRARAWMDERKQLGLLGRPELIFVPFQDLSARRVGVFERRVPVRVGIRSGMFGTSSGGGEAEPEYIYKHEEDTKVMVADVQRLTPAARTPWGMNAFEPREARKKAELRRFDLVEAQRRATVYAEETTHGVLSDRKLTSRGSSQIVASVRHTLFFPFWSIPVQSESGSYEIVVEGVSGEVIAWRMPERSPSPGLRWLASAVPGSLALGYGLNAMLAGSGPFDPVIAIVLGAILTAISLHRSNAPDWAIRSWPQPDTLPPK